MGIEYYTDGRGRYLASLNYGSSGFFIIYNLEISSEWNFVIPQTIQWDSLHQNIYRNQRDFSLCSKHEIMGLPQLPAVPPYERVSWEDNFSSLPTLLVSDFPHLSSFLLKNKPQVARFWFLLFEDMYESRYGDGKFLYWSNRVYHMASKATKFMEKENLKLKRNPEGTKYILKSFVLKIENNQLIAEDYLPSLFENYEIGKIINRIESTLASNGAISWGDKA